MQLPLQVTFRDMPRSEAVETKIREKTDKLGKFYDRIMSCRVVVQAPHLHHHQGKLYSIRIDITVPNGELVVSRDHHDDHSHEDLYVALRDAFSAAERQLKTYVRKQRREIKTHNGPPHGRVAELNPELDFGTISTDDGREIYFHRNSVLNGGFDKLAVGALVRYSEESGERGPQASTVQTVGKHSVSI